MRQPPRRYNSRWTPEEDEELVRLVKLHGVKNWTLISKSLPGRVGKQCRERWRNQLDPNIKTTPFDDEEDQKIMDFVAENGTRWARISEILEGRTENAIKNRYYSNLSKRMPKAKSAKSKRKSSISSTSRRKRDSDSSSEAALSSDAEFIPDEPLTPSDKSTRAANRRLSFERSQRLHSRRYTDEDFEYEEEQMEDEYDDEDYIDATHDTAEVEAESPEMKRTRKPLKGQHDRDPDAIIPASPGYCSQAAQMTETEMKKLEHEAVSCLLGFKTPKVLDVAALLV